MSTKDPSEKLPEAKDPVPTLETLPNEIKEIILLHLAPNDLLNLMQTCKTFNSFVEDSKNLMDKFTARASKMISSDAVSHRNYPRIFVDCDLSTELIESAKKFVNMEQCVKVIIFDKRIHPVQFELFETYSEALIKDRFDQLGLVKNFVSLCPNYITINMVDDSEKNLENMHKTQTKVKTFNAFCRALIIPDFQDIQEINLYESFHNWPLSMPGFGGSDKLKRINFFKSMQSKLFMYDRSHRHLVSGIGHEKLTVEEITVQDCPIFGFHFRFSGLKTLKLVNCRTDEDPFEFIGQPLDELHIENCGKLLWIQEGESNSQIVKHLRLVSMKYPRSYAKLIKATRKNVETLTMIDVTFEDEQVEEA